jgi:hypothetical protein
VFPEHDPKQRPALVYSVHNWDSVLAKSFPNHLEPLMGVLWSGSAAYTYRLKNGIVHFLGAT